jgi:hypothetical protein
MKPKEASIYRSEHFHSAGSVHFLTGVDTTKYQLSNAPLDTTIDRFAQMSCSRYWIERAFQDEKGLAGFADFRGRSWLGWHHHITMAMFSMMMMMFVCIDFGQFADLLTVQDIKLIYEKSFARKQFSNNDVLLLLKKRHKEREAAKISHHRVNSHLSNV